MFPHNRISLIHGGSRGNQRKRWKISHPGTPQSGCAPPPAPTCRYSPASTTPAPGQWRRGVAWWVCVTDRGGSVSAAAQRVQSSARFAGFGDRRDKSGQPRPGTGEKVWRTIFPYFPPATPSPCFWFVGKRVDAPVTATGINWTVGWRNC